MLSLAILVGAGCSDARDVQVAAELCQDFPLTEDRCNHVDNAASGPDAASRLFADLVDQYPDQETCRTETVTKSECVDLVLQGKNPF